MIPRDVYLEPDAPDPVLGPDSVLGFARRHIPTAAIVTAVDETGGEARAYVIDDRYVLKTQRPHRRRPRTNLQKEVFYLRQIAEQAPELPVPRVLGSGQEGSVEYILMTRIPGAALKYVALEGTARRAALIELGRVLARMHALPLAPFERTGLVPGDKDAGDVQARIGQGLRQALDVTASQEEAFAGDPVLEALPERLLGGAPIDGRRAPLHSNPGPEHAFVDPSSRKLQGLIDFGDAYMSHPCLDLRRWTAPGDRSAVLEGYSAKTAVDEAFLRTLRIAQSTVLLDIMVQQPERRQAALDDLRALITER